MNPHPTASLTLCLQCGAPTSPGRNYCCSACEWLASDEWIKELPARGTPEKWRPYDDRQIWKNYDQSRSPESLKFHLHVAGLQCSSCVHLLEKLPEYDPAIREVRVRYGESDLFLEMNPVGRPGWVASLIEEMGYEPHFLLPSEDGAELQEEEDRGLLRRIAVAGACSGNIMLFTVPIYAGLAGSWKDLFNLIGLLLFLPILLYSAVPFYKGAWAALRTGRINVDLPLTVAMLGGFVASTWNFLRGSDFLYFDSTAGFLFLILVSRWFLRKSHRHWTKPEERLPWTQEIYQVRVSTNLIRGKILSQLKEDDVVQLSRQDVVPADGVLTSPHAVFSTALNSGEPFPRTFQQGQKILGGYQLLSDEAVMTLAKSPQESEMAKAWKMAQKEALYKGRRLSLFDQASQVLLGVVLTLGLLVLVAAPWLGLTWEDGFQRALALWIVACPCALAFGGPLAYAMALRKASKNGILIKSADVFDRLPQVKNIAFDKTGTLTEGRLRLVETHPSPLPPFWKSLILGLEKDSYHPVAHAFREAWPEHLNDTKSVEQVHEVMGSKVFGIFDHKLYSLQASPKESDALVIELRHDQKVLAEMEFEDILRPEAATLLQDLSPRYDLYLLSGDKPSRAARLGESLPLAAKNVFGGLSPSDKAAFIEAKSETLMIGDGANDGPAFAKAAVSIAMSGALEQSLRLADVYFIRSGLLSLKDLLQIGASVQKTVHRNLFFALGYNVIAGAFALAGFMNPLIAALLMPLSSALILLSTWEGSR
ncbi:MAG: HAD-IC family P-type ATPase [Bdellovibrionaceae bacterium]|nr:HAD-IC family P-type ATPase [Pseudobdellovibrionaceae bacterium]